MSLARSRFLWGMAFLLAMLALIAGLYVEHVAFLRPCPTCVVQRGCLALVAFASAVAWVHRPGIRGTRLYAGGVLLLVGAGAASAIRQLWLQAQAPLQERFCNPNLLHFDKSEALLQVLKVFMLGSPDCAIVTWTLLDMSLPEWSLLTFAGLGLITFIQLFQR